MKRIFYGLALAIALAPSSATIGVNAEPHDVHAGAGAMSCGQWLSAREGLKQPRSSSYQDDLLNESMMASWVQGFTFAGGMSAGASVNDFLQAIPDSDSVEAWTDKYCREQPLKKIANAAAALVGEIRSQLPPR